MQERSATKGEPESRGEGRVVGGVNMLMVLLPSLYNQASGERVERTRERFDFGRRAAQQLEFSTSTSQNYLRVVTHARLHL